MIHWYPALYGRFEGQRTRLAAGLPARVPLAETRQVVDRGCGPGNSTGLPVRRFPHAHVRGTDDAKAMMAADATRGSHAGDAGKVRAELLDIDVSCGLLGPVAIEVDVWHAGHQLPHDANAAIVDRVRVTGMKPFADRIPQDGQLIDHAKYQHQADAGYPVSPDGDRLLAFPPALFVAGKKGLSQ